MFIKSHRNGHHDKVLLRMHLWFKKIGASIAFGIKRNVNPLYPGGLDSAKNEEEQIPLKHGWSELAEMNVPSVKLPFPHICLRK